MDVESEPDSDSLKSMEEQQPPQTQQIANENWEQTPANVKQLVEEMQEPWSN